MRKILTRKGQNMALLTLEDESGKIDVTVFPNLYAERAALLVNGNFVVLRGRVEQDSRDDVMKVLAESVEPLDDTVVERQEPDTAMPPVTVAVREGGPLPAGGGDLPEWVLNDNNVPTDRPAVVDEPVAVNGEGSQTAAAQTVVAPTADASPRNESVEPEPEQEMQPVADVVDQTGPEVELVLQRTSDDAQDLGLLQRLANVLTRNPGDTLVALRIILNGVHVRIDTHDRIALTPEVEDEIEELLGTAPLRKLDT